MDPVITTPRLKLTLIARAERGSQELEWLHELHSDEKARWWSLMGASKTLEDTEKVIASSFPPSVPTSPANPQEIPYRIFYAVHEIQSPGSTIKFIGTITLRSLETGHKLELSPPLVPAESLSTLTVELAYQFLSAAWGKGYAGESLAAVFQACARAKVFWRPFERVYCRVIVNGGNPASLRVMRKLGVREMGIYKWTGKVWLAGGWRYEDDLYIFGKWLVGEGEDLQGTSV
ncbi:hypothetical protein K458DRAFT_376283 [Lentithecium fluviatile CBS 122367]|uniref:N-acetyltransferase domain-containing protein n=1 Tax=Lentithecium fluviatile CBS 122367 TaxID=1168545 RepID=A0A6G1IKC9_9PLEO|nr:hypothetical protein K458DRAFT_376283 [Lentithecium fluviatile CBS 122367]